MEYFLLNVNRPEGNMVDYWIEERQIAPIFYGQSTIKQIKNNETELTPNQKRDAELFINTFENQNEEAIIFSISDEYIYIYKQIGKLQEIEQYLNKNNTKSLVKGFSIKILIKKLIKESPLILATIKSNRYMSAGTFKKLKLVSENSSYFGNILSIKYLLTDKIQEVKTFSSYLFCLSSLEFETLIAKIFEEKGYFVPAYKGGFIKNYDLFCKKNNETISLQIKLEMEEEYYNESTDYFYCINNNSVPTSNIKNWKDIKEEIEQCPRTKEWLEKTLYWVKICEDG